MKIPPATVLIDAAKEKLGQPDDFGLATILRQRYGLRTTQSSISRWRSRPRGPSYEASYALMEIAGWLSADPARMGLSEAEASAHEAVSRAQRARAVSRRGSEETA